jgi:hypothetical protein
MKRMSKMMYQGCINAMYNSKREGGLSRINPVHCRAINYVIKTPKSVSIGTNLHVMIKVCGGVPAGSGIVHTSGAVVSENVVSNWWTVMVYFTKLQVYLL